MNTQKSDLEKYVDLFYEPRISPYDLMKVFFATLVLNGITNYPRDLMDVLYTAKLNPKYSELFRDIHFGSNGVFHYADEINAAILSLKQAGIIYTISPRDDVIRIVMDKNTARDMICNIDANDLALVEELIKDNFK